MPTPEHLTPREPQDHPFLPHEPSLNLDANTIPPPMALSPENSDATNDIVYERDDGTDHLGEPYSQPPGSLPVPVSLPTVPVSPTPPEKVNIEESVQPTEPIAPSGSGEGAIVDLQSEYAHLSSETGQPQSAETVSKRKVDSLRDTFVEVAPEIRSLLGTEEGSDTHFVGVFGSCVNERATEDSDVDGYLFYRRTDATPENHHLNHDLSQTFDAPGQSPLGYPEGRKSPNPEGLEDIEARDITRLPEVVAGSKPLDPWTLRSIAVVFSPVSIGDEDLIASTRAAIKEAMIRREGKQYDPSRYGEHRIEYGLFEDYQADGDLTWHLVRQEHRKLFEGELLEPLVHTETDMEHAVQRELHDRSQSSLRRGDGWASDQFRFPHIKSPEVTSLAPLLGEGVPLQAVVEDRSARGMPTHVLDLFGSGEFLLDPTKADSITGVRLLDTQYKSERGYRPRPPHHRVLEGDLYAPEAWERLKQYMDANDIPGFDMVVCTPQGPWTKSAFDPKYSVSAYLKAMDPVLQGGYDVLSSNHGVFYTEIPSAGLTRRQLGQWEERVNNSGIHVRVKLNLLDDAVAAITRRPDSPPRIAPLREIL